MYYDILDEKRTTLLPTLSAFREDFYLAGGTALALQLGHRDSIDFDFFMKEHMNEEEILKRVKSVFENQTIRVVQSSRETLTILVDDEIKLSFFGYNYPLLQPLIREKYLTLASLADIACMKLSAIVSRATMKDYIDIVEILKGKYSLAELLSFAEKKFPELDTMLILKSLVYFDDVTDEPILWKHGHDTSFDDIKRFLQREVKTYSIT
jgi:predicted nucleotidyltransferase component of viral defense system